MLALPFLLPPSAHFPHPKKSRAWNMRLKIMLTFLKKNPNQPENEIHPTPQFFIIESLFLVVTKPIYYKNIDNSHIPFFLEQINIFIKSDSTRMCALQCSGLFTLQ